MKGIYRLGLSGLLSISLIAPVNAEDAGVFPGMPDTNLDSISSPLNKLATYLKNLGAFLGYELGDADVNVESRQLLNAPAVQLNHYSALNAQIGATPFSTAAGTSPQIVPPSYPSYNAFNALVNDALISQPYNSAQGAKQGRVSINPLIDQQGYQSDPVSQSILNLLGTPDDSFCMNSASTAWLPKGDSSCPPLYYSKVMSNILGGFPNTNQFFSYSYNQSFLPQLNSNALISPLLYTQTSTGSSSTGLSAQNPAQIADNFIRYVSGSVKPLRLASKIEYNLLYSQATKKVNTPDEVMAQAKAQDMLTNYLNSLRIYAARASVGYSNLYYILGKRLPQNKTSTTDKPNSQAMSEFVMATRRLYNPEQDINNQWAQKIDQASSATVQKEIAILLSEINYQLYLNRQQDERLLLTQTLTIFQGLQFDPPNLGAMIMEASGSGEDDNE